MSIVCAKSRGVRALLYGTTVANLNSSNDSASEHRTFVVACHHPSGTIPCCVGIFRKPNIRYSTVMVCGRDKSVAVVLYDFNTTYSCTAKAEYRAYGSHTTDSDGEITTYG